MHGRVCSAPALLMSIIIWYQLSFFLLSEVTTGWWTVFRLEQLFHFIKVSRLSLSPAFWRILMAWMSDGCPTSILWDMVSTCAMPVFLYLGPAVQWLLLNTVVLLSAPGSIQPENPMQPAIGIFSKLGTSRIFSPFLVLALPCSI